MAPAVPEKRIPSRKAGVAVGMRYPRFRAETVDPRTARHLPHVKSWNTSDDALSADPRKGWLFVLPWEPTAIGGVSRVVNELAASLAHGANYDPWILVLDWGARAASYDRSRSTTVIRFGIRDRGSSWSRRRLMYWLSRPSVALQLRRILSSIPITVVNVHYPTDQALELLRTIRSIRPDIKTIVSFHGMDSSPLSTMDATERRRWARELECATAVTCCSLGLLRRLHASLGGPLSNSVVRHNGASRLSGSPHSSAPESKRVTVLSVGTYHVNKAHDVLFNAFARIAPAHPELDLRILGRSGPTRENIAALVRRCGLAGRVRLEADVALDDMGAVYDDALMFVSASRFEPFGISILEAGAAGLPVIATDTDGAREILEPDVDGLVVPTDDAESLARAIARLATDGALRERLARNLRSKVLREFQWDSIVVGWEALAADHGRHDAPVLDASA